MTACGENGRVERTHFGLAAHTLHTPTPVINRFDLVRVVISARVKILIVDRAHVERQREGFKIRAWHERLQQREHVEDVDIRKITLENVSHERGEGLDSIVRRHTTIIPDESPRLKERTGAIVERSCVRDLDLQGVVRVHVDAIALDAQHDALGAPAEQLTLEHVVGRVDADSDALGHALVTPNDGDPIGPAGPTARGASNLGLRVVAVRVSRDADGGLGVGDGHGGLLSVCRRPYNNQSTPVWLAAQVIFLVTLGH